MEFNVSSGRASSMNIANAEKIDDLNAYWFSCPLNALELNDTVTASYRYDADRTITQSYTVLQYIEKAKAELPGTANLLNALQNHGHYIQESGWTMRTIPRCMISDACFTACRALSMRRPQTPLRISSGSRSA